MLLQRISKNMAALAVGNEEQGAGFGWI
jgi:hypothetical protein